MQLPDRGGANQSPEAGSQTEQIVTPTHLSRQVQRIDGECRQGELARCIAPRIDNPQARRQDMPKTFPAQPDEDLRLAKVDEI
jgi:hypothetical protein